MPLRTNFAAKPFHMKPNMGNLDRRVRALVAVVVAILYFTGVLKGTLGMVLLVVAAVFLATSYWGFCPIYTVFGLRTDKRDRTA